MKEINILKEVEEITKIAKNIFGDIVYKVYIVKHVYNIANKELKITAISKQVISIIKNSTENNIDQDGQTIMIEFTNGKKVQFHNSEWGSITSFMSDDKDIYL